MSVSATIFNISRGSFHDGPGVRTVIYLKGCGLSCKWCHNPEGQLKKVQLSYSENKCIGCGECVKICKKGCFAQRGSLFVEFSKCDACAECVKSCPSGALTLIGEKMTSGRVFKILENDRVYFERSGGGATFSGGECLLYPEFMEDILLLCKNAGIHTLIETSLDVSESTVLRILPISNAVYADIKHMNTKIHKDYTGRGNERILKNFAAVAKIHDNITVRVPLIPDINDDIENLEKTVEFAMSCGIPGMELLRYNYLAGSKYDSIGRKIISFSESAHTISKMDELCVRLNKLAGKDGFVKYQK